MPARSSWRRSDDRAGGRLAAANLIVALVALFGGVTTGIFQALEYAGVEIYPSLAPFVRSHYHSVSMHGVLNALVFTTFFICGFVPFIFSRALGAPLACPRLAWWTFWIMTAGLVLAAIPLVGNAATVMFTFYPPLKAHWPSISGSRWWSPGRGCHAEPGGELARLARTERRRAEPLAAFMSLVTFAMWSIASLGLAAEMLFMLIPWSLGLVGGTDALLARTLFWFTGHPIVYFWLLPAYISWYTLVPRQAGASSSATRWRAPRSCCSSCCRRPSASITSTRIPGSTRGGSSCTPCSRSRLLPEPAHVLQRRRLARDRGPRARATGWVNWFGRLPWSDPSLSRRCWR